MAIERIDVIANGREQIQPGVLPQNVLKAHEDYFLKALFDSVQFDLTQPVLSDYFYRTRGFRELELKGSYIVKNETGIALQHDYQQRHVHGLIAVNTTRTVAFPMLALDGMPEPWQTSQTSDAKP